VKLISSEFRDKRERRVDVYLEKNIFFSNNRRFSAFQIEVGPRPLINMMVRNLMMNG
jgi:hypothetical protein